MDEAPPGRASTAASSLRGYVTRRRSPGLVECTAQEPIALVNRRTRQADLLARFALLRVLESPTMFNIFRTEQQIQEFRQLDDAERESLWGDRLDILAIQ